MRNQPMQLNTGDLTQMGIMCRLTQLNMRI